jgi:Ala-tRNA(Pro) deacylase
MITVKIDPVIYKEKPQDNRRKEEMDTYDLLDSLGVGYIRIDHEETPSIEACDEVEKILGIEICKNLFLCNANKTRFYLLMMPGSKMFKTKDLSRQIGSSRLSFADASYMKEFLHISPGSVSVLGLMNDTGHNVSLLIDKDVLCSESIGCHPCVNTSSLKLRTDDLLQKFLPYTGHTPVSVEL